MVITKVNFFIIHVYCFLQLVFGHVNCHLMTTQMDTAWIGQMVHAAVARLEYV